MRTSRRPGPLTAAFDRGPAKYFHGRKQILHDFKELLVRATQTKSGTTFLIQGAPGAGKTALLYECGKMAEKRKWKTVDVNPRALWNADELRHSLSLGNIPEVKEAAAQIGAGPFVQADVKSELPRRTTLEILRSRQGPLLLRLDEAQMLATTVHPLPPDPLGIATGLLKAIHNGELKRPVILLVGGLGTTSDAFRGLGISRFSRRCLVELGALSKEAEQAVLRDWLTKDGGAKGDPTPWIDSIAQETHGWPQHILSYVEPALDQLRADKRVMTPEGLHAVLEKGRGFRSEYYEHRAHGFPEEERQSIARPFRNIPPGEGITLGEIMASLTQEYSEGKSEEIFRRALAKGIIDARSGRYAVPIPSMQDWLVSRYADS